MRCFTAEQEALWKEARSLSQTRCIPCADCTIEYKVEMCLQDRCEHPEVKFRIDSDGWEEGYIPPIGNGLEIADKAIRLVREHPVKITRFEGKFSVTPVQFQRVGELVGIYALGITVDQIEADMREVA